MSHPSAVPTHVKEPHPTPPDHGGSARVRKSPAHHLLRHKKKATWLLPLLLVGALAGGFWLHYRLTHVEENDARVEAEVVTIASRVDGWLLRRPVIEGDLVRKGDVLGELDARDARLRLKNLEAGIAAFEAQIRETTILRDTLQKTTVAQLAAAEAAVAVVEPQLETARSDFARDDELLKSNSVPKQEWDHSHNALKQQEAALQQARENVTIQKAALAQAEQETQQIEMLKSQRDALAAQAEQVRQEIEDRVIRAPSDGVIDKTFIHAGDYVQTGQWLMMMHDPNDIWVEASVKETAVGRVKPGQPVKITVDAYPGLVLRGKVWRVGNAATNQFALLPSPNPSGNFTKITQRVPVRIALEKPARPLQPGLMVEVSINVSH